MNAKNVIAKQQPPMRPAPNAAAGSSIGTGRRSNGGKADAAQCDDLKQVIAETTAEIIKGLENNVAPWTRPWSKQLPFIVVIGANERVNDGSPRNIAGPVFAFSHLNAVVLRVRAITEKYRTDFWVSEERIKSLGVSPKDRQRPCVIVRHFSDQDVRHAEGFRRLYNLDQIENLDALGAHIKPSRDASRGFRFSFDRAKEGLKTLGATILEGKPKAAYCPAKDVIDMPLVHQFIAKAKGSRLKGESHYWATLWHEIVHWTGHETRLRRRSLLVRGDDEYAQEELIAELGAAFLCSYFGIRGRLQYEAYIKHWLRYFQENEETALMDAVEAAEESAYYVRDVVKVARKKRK